MRMVMWISSDFEKKDNMYNATENYFRYRYP